MPAALPVAWPAASGALPGGAIIMLTAGLAVRQMMELL